MSHATGVSGGDLMVPFGIDKDKIAADLQRLADDIRMKRVYPQAVATTTRNAMDNFEMITLELTYAGPQS